MESTDYVSLTKMVKEINAESGQAITRDMLCQAMIDTGYISDIHTITDFGLTHGCAYRHNDEGRCWPVYSPALVQSVAQDAEMIAEKYKGLQKQRTPKKDAVTNTTSHVPLLSIRLKSLPHLLSNNWYFPYLGLDDCVILDTEATGVGTDDEVVELSIMAMDGFVLYHSYFYPQKEVDAGAQMVNHLSKQVLAQRGARYFRDEWRNIKFVIGNARVLGHNISYDIRLIKQTLAKYGCDVSEADKIFANADDTIRIVKNWVATKSYSLNNLAHLLGIDREESHDATDDCKMTLEVLQRVEKILAFYAEMGILREM